jgi:hypothetical protein
MGLVKFSEDMNQEEKIELKKFREDGLPGINQIREADIIKWQKLYLSGKTYVEISEIAQKPKVLILFISDKLGWFEKKINYYNDVTVKVFEKLEQIRMESMNTIATMISGWNKLYGDKFNSFLTDNNSLTLENMDNKQIPQYYKAIELLDKLTENVLKKPIDEPKKEKGALVNINVGDNINITKTGENSVEVRSAEIKETDNPGEVLRKLALLEKQGKDK